MDTAFLRASDQEIVDTFRKEADAVRHRLAAGGLHEAGLSYWDAGIDAFVFFGLTERNARRAERRRALDFQLERTKDVDELIRDYNAKGLERLKDARRAADRMNKVLQQKTASAEDVKTRVEGAEVEVKRVLAKLDLSAEDTREVYDVCRQGFDVALEGPAALRKHLKRSLDELEQARGRPDRGLPGNPIPWWKIGILIAIFGVWIMFALHCTSQGCNPVTIFVVAFVLFLLAAVGLFLFC